MAILRKTKHKIGKLLSPRGSKKTGDKNVKDKIKGEKEAAEILVKKATRESSSPRVKPRKKADQVLQERMKSTKKSKHLEGDYASTENSEKAHGSSETTRSSDVQSNDAWDEMNHILDDIRSTYKNVNRVDLMILLQWRIEQWFPHISRDAMNSFVEHSENEWNKVNQFQMIALRRDYSLAEHAAVNRANREICYGRFLELSSKYSIKTDEDGNEGIFIPKEVAVGQLRKDISAFVVNETDKDGFEYRWKKNSVGDEIGDFKRRGNVVNEAFFSNFIQIHKVFEKDSDFQA